MKPVQNQTAEKDLMADAAAAVAEGPAVVKATTDADIKLLK
jgi:hypothetical protein